MKKQLSNVMEVRKERTSTKVDTPVQKTDLPFSPNMMSYPLPPKFRIPQIEAFDGNQDPFDHLKAYKILMRLYNILDGIMC